MSSTEQFILDTRGALNIKSSAQKVLSHSFAIVDYMFSIEQTRPVLTDNVYFGSNRLKLLVQVEFLHKE